MFLCTVMEKFEVNILGCGSALPTTRHFPSSQVLNVRDKLYMIDCGEGTQLQFRKSHLKFSRLNHIFISHLHGDHCFGLPGLISTLDLLGRTADLHIYAPAGLEELMKPWLEFFCIQLSFHIFFHVVDTQKRKVVFEDRSLTVTSIPLKHRVPCCGFLVEEKQLSRHIIRDMVDFYKVPVSQMNALKVGVDFVTPDGTVVPNERLTRPAAPARKYAYCSDTLYLPALAEQVAGVDLLFHEATFAESESARARQTCHTTAKQAATLAKNAGVKRLVIGHFSARYEDEQVLLQEASSVFEPTVLARENMNLSL